MYINCCQLDITFMLCFLATCFNSILEHRNYIIKYTIIYLLFGGYVSVTDISFPFKIDFWWALKCTWEQINCIALQKNLTYVLRMVGSLSKFLNFCDFKITFFTDIPQFLTELKLNNLWNFYVYGNSGSTENPNLTWGWTC